MGSDEIGAVAPWNQPKESRRQQIERIRSELAQFDPQSAISFSLLVASQDSFSAELATLAALRQQNADLLARAEQAERELAAMTKDRDHEAAVGEDWFREYNEMRDDRDRWRRRAKAMLMQVWRVRIAAGHLLDRSADLRSEIRVQLGGELAYANRSRAAWALRAVEEACRADDANTVCDGVEVRNESLCRRIIEWTDRAQKAELERDAALKEMRCQFERAQAFTERFDGARKERDAARREVERLTAVVGAVNEAVSLAGLDESDHDALMYIQNIVRSEHGGSDWVVEFYEQQDRIVELQRERDAALAVLADLYNDATGGGGQ